MRFINPLLPPNSTEFEHKVSDLAADNTRLDVNIQTLTDATTAPSDFLSFLAWQYSVDSWDSDWNDDLKRTLIKKSFRQHQLKGTIAAVRQILTDFGFEAKFTEWWQATPPLEPGSFVIDLLTSGLELSESTYQEINKLINDAKPVSRHLANLKIVLGTTISVGAGAIVQDCVITQIEPKFTPAPVIKTTVGSVAHDAVLTSIYPIEPMTLSSPSSP